MSMNEPIFRAHFDLQLTTAQGEIYRQCPSVTILRKPKTKMSKKIKEGISA